MDQGTEGLLVTFARRFRIGTQHRDDDEVHEHELAAATVVWLIAIGLVARNLIRGG